MYVNKTFHLIHKYIICLSVARIKNLADNEELVQLEACQVCVQLNRGTSNVWTRHDTVMCTNA